MFGLSLIRDKNGMGLVRRSQGSYGGGPVFPDGMDLYK